MNTAIRDLRNQLTIAAVAFSSWAIRLRTAQLRNAQLALLAEEDPTAILAGARVIRHRLNEGYGATIKTCLDYARGNEADILVILDGDGQHLAEIVCRPKRFAQPAHGFARLVTRCPVAQSCGERLGAQTFGEPVGGRTSLH